MSLSSRVLLLEKIAEVIILGHEFFKEDRFAEPATERFIEVLGEACRMISEERKAEFPEVNWAEIIGLRTRLAHIYHRIDYETFGVPYPMAPAASCVGLIIPDCNGVVVDSEVLSIAVDELVLIDLGWPIGRDRIITR